jgi:hypothetical protein
MCNGIITFDDSGALTPNGQLYQPSVRVLCGAHERAAA